MSLFRILATVGCSTLAAVCLQAFPQPACADDAWDLEFFEKRIRPALIRHCYECHSSVSAELKGGLRLDSRNGIRTGGETGPAVVPGQVEESLLISALRHESFEMPPDRKLSDAVIANFVTWVESGAFDPRDRPATSDEVAERSWQAQLESRRDWWSLQPVRKLDVASAKGGGWSDHTVDQFIEAKLKHAGLAAGQEAEPLVLLRRLSLILTGLPPTTDELAEYEAQVAHNPPKAYSGLVDRLLESPHFGERWARHWMDVVRFSETHGYEWNHEIRDAWQYRDYLIRAFNDDLGYDQFVREHIAGDLLEFPRINDNLHINESVIATAFWRFGELGHDNCIRFPEIRFDALDNQIDTVTKAFQAMTVACARCHDHKFDAISTRDYYALAGILESSRNVVQTVSTPGRIRFHAEQLLFLRAEIRKQVADTWLAALDDVPDAILTALEVQPVSSDDDLESASPLVKQLARDDVAMEEPVSILQRVAARPTDIDVVEAWTEARAAYRQEHTARQEFNAENFEPWFTVGGNEPGNWQVLGLGPGDQLRPPGEFVVAVTGDEAIAAVLPGGVHTHWLSSQLNGTVRSPWMPGNRRFGSLLFLGGGLSLVRSVVDSCTLNEFAGGGLEYLSNDTLQWRTYPTRENEEHRAFLELTTKSDNVRWPDRPGRAGKDEALLQSPRSWFSVVQAVVHDCEEKPRPPLSHLQPLFEGPDAVQAADVAKAFQKVCRKAVADWKRGRASDDDVRWINWALTAGLLPNTTQGHAELQRLVQDYRQVESTLPASQVIAGMADHGSGFDSPVLVRGNPAVLGPPEPRRYLEVVTGSRSPLKTNGSGRRELADLITNEHNPLTARVMVNRVWHHVFGAGLVRTPDDFGHLGDLPSHPELLDFLAHHFVQKGWSIKTLIRRIVSSRTFRQSSVSTAAGRKVDPDNRLLHHFPVRRLDAEAIRDTILAVSGRLDRRQFGPSIHPFRAEAKDHRKLYIGPLDGDGRRSLYVKVTRMEGPRFLELFDRPELTETRGRRDRTNVPAQALALLNDPFVVAQSRFWGEALATRSDEIPADRMEHVFRRTLGRSPRNHERDRVLAFVDRIAELHGVTSADIPSSPEIWQDVAHVMYNMKELIYIQ